MALFELLLRGKTLRHRYLLEDALGHGGMGAVFRARDLELDRPVAVKVVIFPESSPELHENLRSRFRREGKLAAGLHHPHVVRTYDFGRDEELSLDYLVMELLRGIDLKQYLAQRGLPPPEQARRMLLEAARGIAAGHRARLIHRDVKPANLFLADSDDDEPRVVVLDFGIALPDSDDHTVTRLTQAAVGPHSRLYAAPEQLEGRTLTPACDVFSLGATGFELFTGKAMALGEGSAAGTESTIREARAFIADHADRFPPGVANVLIRCLAPQPEERYPDAGALVAALQDPGTEPAPRPAAIPVPRIAPVPEGEEGPPIAEQPSGPAPAPRDPAPETPPATPPRPEVPARDESPKPETPAPDEPRPRSVRGPVLALIAGVLAWLAPLPEPRPSYAGNYEGISVEETTPVVPPTDSVVTTTTTTTSDTGVAYVDPRLALSEALAMFTPEVLSRVEQLGYRPAQLLARESFYSDQVVDDLAGSLYFAHSGGRAWLRTRATGMSAVKPWYVSHRNVIARVNLRWESGAMNIGAGFGLRDGVEVLIDGASDDGYTGYLIGNSTGSGWTDVVPWTTSSAIQGNRDNTLEIVAAGGSVSLYLNGIHVQTTTGILDQTGSAFSLRVGSAESTYSFDDMAVVALEVR